MHDSGGVMAFFNRRWANFTDAPRDLEEHRERYHERAGGSHLEERVLGYPYMGEWYKGWGVLGFGHYAGQPRSDYLSDPSLKADDLQVIAPYWFLLILTLLLPVRWTAPAVRARRRRGAGLCPRCGFNLRATPGRCPECGGM